MKKMIKLSFALLFALCIFAGYSKTSIEVSAWGGATCPSCHMHGYHQAYVYDTIYPNADNINHQVKDSAVFICGHCGRGWTGTVYWTERHSTPNNQACKCGFIPHR